MQILSKCQQNLGLSPEDFAKQYQVGKPVVLPSFTSTSIKEGVSKGFAMNEGSDGTKIGILLIMNVIKGKDISDLSADKGEKEILLAPNSTFTVNTINKEGGNMVLVEMTQTS